MATLPPVPWHIFTQDLQTLRDEANRRRNQPLADTCAAATLAMQASTMAIQNRDIAKAQQAEADASEALWQVFTVAADTLRGTKFGLTGIAGLGKLAAANLMLPTQVPVTCSMLKKMISPPSQNSSSGGGGGGSLSSSSSSGHDEDVHMRVAQTLCSMLCSSSARGMIELPLSVSLLLYCTTPSQQVQAATLAAVIQVTEPLLDDLIPDDLAPQSPQQKEDGSSSTSTSSSGGPEPHLADGSVAQALHMRAVYFLRDCMILAGWTATNAAFAQPLWLKLDTVPSHNKHLLSVLCLDLLLNFFSARDTAVQQLYFQQQSQLGGGGAAAASASSSSASAARQRSQQQQQPQQKVHNGTISKSRLSHVAAVINATFVPVFCASSFSPSQEIFSRFHRLAVAVVGQLWPLFEPKPLHALLEKNEQLALGGGGPIRVVQTVSIPSTEAGWRVLSVVAQWRRVVAVVGLLPRLVQAEFDAHFASPELQVAGVMDTAHYKKNAAAAWQKNPLVKLLLAPAKVLEAMVSSQQQQQQQHPQGGTSVSPGRDASSSSGGGTVVWAPELVGVLVDFTTTLCQALARWFCSSFKKPDGVTATATTVAAAGTKPAVADGSIPPEAAHALFDVIFSQLYCCFALALSRLSGEDVLHSALKAVVHLVTCACVVRHSSARDAFLVLLANELRRGDGAAFSDGSNHHALPQAQQPTSRSRANTGTVDAAAGMGGGSDESEQQQRRARLLTERKMHILNTVVSIANGLGNELGHAWRIIVQCFLAAQDMIAASQQHADRESNASDAAGNNNSTAVLGRGSPPNHALAAAAAAGLIVDEQELRSASFAMEHVFESTVACFSNEALLTLCHFLAQGSSDAEDDAGNRILPRDPLVAKNSATAASSPDQQQLQRDRARSSSPAADGRTSPISPLRGSGSSAQRLDSLSDLPQQQQRFQDPYNYSSPLQGGGSGVNKVVPALSTTISADGVKFILSMFQTMLRATITSPVLFAGSSGGGSGAAFDAHSNMKQDADNGDSDDEGGDKSSAVQLTLRPEDVAAGITLSELRVARCIWPAVRSFVASVCRSTHLPAGATTAAISFSEQFVSLLGAAMDQLQAQTQHAPTSPTRSSSSNKHSSGGSGGPVIPSARCAALMSLPLQLLLELFQRSDGLFCANVKCRSHEARRLLAHEALRIVQQHGAAINGDGWQHLCRLSELSATVSSAGTDVEVLTTAFRIVELIHHGNIVQLGPLGLIKFIACVGAFVRQQVSDTSLSVNLSAVHIAWSIADFIVAQQQEQQEAAEIEGGDGGSVKQGTSALVPPAATLVDAADTPGKKSGAAPFAAGAGGPRSAVVATPERQVTWASLQWDALLIQLRDGGCDPRPEIRQSSLRSLFAVVSTHGQALPAEVWATCVWDVLLQVVDRFESDVVAPLRNDGILAEDGARVQARKIGAAGGEGAFFFGRADQQTSVSKKSMPEAAAAQERSSRRGQWLEVYISLLEGLPRVIMKFVDFISRHAPNSSKVFGRLVSFAATALLAVASEAVSIAASRLLSCLLSELAPCPAALDAADFDAVLTCLNEVGQRCQSEQHFTLNVLKSLIDSFAPALRNLALMGGHAADSGSNSNNAAAPASSPSTSSSASLVALSIAANSSAVPQRLFGSAAARAERAQCAIERFVSFVESALNSEAIQNTFMFPASVQVAAIEFADAVARLLASGAETSGKLVPSPLAALIGKTGGVASAWLALQQLLLSRVPSPALVAQIVELAKQQQPSSTASGKIVERGSQPAFVTGCLRWIAASWPLIDADSRSRLLPEVVHVTSHCAPLASLPTGADAGGSVVGGYVSVGTAAVMALCVVCTLGVPRMCTAELTDLLKIENGATAPTSPPTPPSSGSRQAANNNNSNNNTAAGALPGTRAGNPNAYLELQLHYDLASPPKFVASQHTAVVKSCVVAVTDALAKGCTVLCDAVLVSKAQPQPQHAHGPAVDALLQLISFCNLLLRAVFDAAQVDAQAAACVEPFVSRLLDGLVAVAATETEPNRKEQQRAAMYPLVEAASAGLIAAFALIDAAGTTATSAAAIKIDPKIVEQKVVERTEKLVAQYLRQHQQPQRGDTTTAAATVAGGAFSDPVTLAQRLASSLAAFVPPATQQLHLLSVARKSLLRRVAALALPLVAAAPDANVRQVVQQLFAAILHLQS